MTKVAKRVEDLDVYREAFKLQQEIFRLTKTFPKDELYSLIDQIRRSSRSIGACISEAWGKRLYPAHFTSKLSDADSEAEETRHWLRTAKACDYVDKEKRDQLIDKYNKVGAMLGKMMSQADLWCSQ